MIELTLRFDVSPLTLEKVSAVIAALQEQSDELPPDDLPTGIAPVHPGPVAANAADHVESWLSHLGRDSRRFWRMAAEYSLTHTSFTFDELETHSGISRASLRSYHRNTYRAIKAES